MFPEVVRMLALYKQFLLLRKDRKDVRAVVHIVVRALVEPFQKFVTEIRRTYLKERFVAVAVKEPPVEHPSKYERADNGA